MGNQWGTHLLYYTSGTGHRITHDVIADIEVEDFKMAFKDEYH